MSENWKELSSQFFEMFHDHDCEWFPEGASTLDKQHISQVMLEQAEAIRTRVTTAFSYFFICLQYIFDVHCNDYKVQFVITNGYCNCVNIFLMFTVNNGSKLCHLDSTLRVSRFLSCSLYVIRLPCLISNRDFNCLHIAGQRLENDYCRMQQQT